MVYTEGVCSLCGEPIMFLEPFVQEHEGMERKWHLICKHKEVKEHDNQKAAGRVQGEIGQEPKVGNEGTVGNIPVTD